MYDFLTGMWGLIALIALIVFFVLFIFAPLKLWTIDHKLGEIIKLLKAQNKKL